MPYRSLGDKFVGRVEPLWRVYDQLSQGKTSIVEGVGVVCGAGGLGKTQLAVEYVHRFNCHYPGGVFWVEADQGIARLIDVLSRSAKIEVDGKRPAADQLEEIWTELNRRAAILVVLDNFLEREPLEPWLPPSGNIHVVVTTRRRDLTRHPQVSLPLLTVEREEARDPLKKAYASALSRLGFNHPTTRTFRANMKGLEGEEGGGD